MGGVDTLTVVDLFAGAGGASTGVQLAARQLGLELQLTAINHWPAAVRTHAANHPAAAHLCMAVEAVDPRAVVPGGRLHLLVAGPECVHHSTARGGKPINDQSRASAWHLLRWCELLQVDHLVIENVPEFRTWGPLDARNRPLKSRKGQTYRAFLAALESLNYRVEARVLNSADYGEATTRKRLFIQAARGRRRIEWPEASHGRAASLLRRTARWRAAREVIDWSLPSASIFHRPRPLSPNTLRRIQAGLERFGGRPFVLGQHGGATPRSTDEPLPTVTADGAISCVEPFLVPFYGEAPGQQPRTHSVDEPVPTMNGSTSPNFGDAGRVEPFTMPYCSNGDALARPVSEPMGTITTRDRIALVIPEGLDVRFRMLQPHELAAAMGFPVDYQFVGTKTEAIRMIGNAWSVRVAQALCETVLRRHVVSTPTEAIT